MPAGKQTTSTFNSWTTESSKSYSKHNNKRLTWNTRSCQNFERKHTTRWMSSLWHSSRWLRILRSERLSWVSQSKSIRKGTSRSLIFRICILGMVRYVSSATGVWNVRSMGSSGETRPSKSLRYMIYTIRKRKDNSSDTVFKLLYFVKFMKIQRNVIRIFQI